MKITPSILYNFIQCPHKPWRDKYGPAEEKIQESNPFVELLWEKGVLHEKEVIADLTQEYYDASEGTIEERLLKTKAAIESKEKYVYQGVIQNGILFGIPDLLELTHSGYIPVDIKSGTAFEGADEEAGDEGKPKKHYAVQLCLYSEVLIKNGFSNEKRGYILDINKNKVEYDLTAPMGVRSPQSYWDFYDDIKGTVLRLLHNDISNQPAMSGICKMCSWYNSCKKWCHEKDDATQLFNLGRKVRYTLVEDLAISTVSDIIKLDVADLLAKKKKDKEFLKGVGEGTLTKAQQRAYIFKENGPPILYNKLNLPEVVYELYFDIEDDPTQSFVYLHGIYVRENGKEHFKPFVAKNNTEEAERQAWVEFWEYVKSLPENDFAVYYYSAHEKSTYRRMQKKFPDVITSEELEAFFDNENVIDLYSVILKNTDWPLGSYGLKAIATYLGFSWRDETPSGALSIQWFNDYLTDKDPAKLQRILDYNEDDCKATMVLKDGLVKLNSAS